MPPFTLDSWIRPIQHASSLTAGAEAYLASLVEAGRAAAGRGLKRKLARHRPWKDWSALEKAQCCELQSSGGVGAVRLKYGPDTPPSFTVRTWHLCDQACNPGGRGDPAGHRHATVAITDSTLEPQHPASSGPC